ncbi:hypothetical protein K2173_008018 [Erythroxylum novogranatense]|uniref:PWWP domain-containing protein n=1 Tax=Erythroxylum novogranatense TaxID=1862640 RepID=A0AAV8T8E3_9ROSI|nr:hypothetical protein K2173_008018 [Erythroxylum novogranatense]
MKRKATEGKCCAQIESYNSDKGASMVASENGGGSPMPGDLIWIKHSGESWWLAVVVNEDAVSRTSRPRTRSIGDVLIRIYGSSQYLYVDPSKFHSEFQSMLKENNGCSREILLKSLDQVLAHPKSSQSRRQQSKSKGTSRAMVNASGEKSNQNGINQERKLNHKSNSSEDAACNVRAKKAKAKHSKQFTLEKHNLKCRNIDEGDKTMTPLRDEVPKEDPLQSPKSGGSSFARSKEPNARRRKVMQTLGLVAPSGSPFGKDGCMFSESLL